MSDPVDFENPEILIDRGLSLDRFSGDEVMVLGSEGFANLEFGNGIFGWT